MKEYRVREYANWHPKRQLVDEIIFNNLVPLANAGWYVVDPTKCYGSDCFSEGMLRPEDGDIYFGTRFPQTHCF